MRFDEKTGDNIYEVPKELSPVIEFLTDRDRSRGEALLEIYRVTQRFAGHLAEDVAWNPAAMAALINQIQGLVPGDVKPL